jgi:hypothetical protein
MKNREYQEEVAAIIRKLERMDKLIRETEEKKLRSYILYFLGYFYYNIGDMFAAKEELRGCIDLESKFPIEERAFELLDYIWTYEIRPIWWRWWFSSPLHCLRRKVVFSVLLPLIFLLLLLHPFIPGLLPCIQVNWYIYIILITFLIFILFSPSIRRMKIGEMEVELSSPPPLNPGLSTPSMEKMIEDMPKRR